MKSPLKNKPLRVPGESGEGQIQNLLEDEILFPLLFIGVFMILALYEWLRYYNPSPPHPYFMTGTWVIVTTLSSYKIRKGIRKGKKFRQGIEGEKEVGQQLEQLRETGAKVFHDIQGPNFNVDHVVIHPSGIYVIETKTLSKREREDQHLFYDGKVIRLDDKPLPRDPLEQVEANLRWLGGQLKSSTGKEFHMKSIVLFPGWFIEHSIAPWHSDIWVLSPNALPKILNKEPQDRLPPEDLNLASYHLERMIRAR